MIRFACALQLGALLVLAVFLIDTTGATATAFSFVGMPLLGLSILVYVAALVRGRSSRGQEGMK
jgi:hypothetical protein